MSKSFWLKPKVCIPPAPVGLGLKSPHLVPGVGSVRGVHQGDDDLGLRDQRSCSFGSLLGVEVIGALLKQKLRSGVRWDGGEVHIPGKGMLLRVRQACTHPR